jgi:hypothetical protein
VTVGKLSHHYRHPVDWIGLCPTYSLCDNTSKLSFSRQSMLISNQKTTESFKGVIPTSFLVCLLVRAKIRHEHVEWCSQAHPDQLDELSILLLVVLSTVAQFQLEFLDTHQIVLYSLKGMRIERDQLFLPLHGQTTTSASSKLDEGSRLH